MRLRKLGIIAFYVLLLTSTLSVVGKSASEEIHSVYPLEYAGLEIDIWAPYQAYPGEAINVTVITKSAIQKSLYIKYINMNFFGVVNSTTKVTLAEITHLENSSLSSHQDEYSIIIPENISPGLTYGEISCEWDFMGAPQKLLPTGFSLTYIEDIASEELQAEYEALNSTYYSTLEDYNQLESKFKGEADSTRNLMYVFIATTVIATITVGVLLIRKPKKVWA